MKKIIILLLFFYTQFCTVLSHASVEVSKNGNITSIKNKGSFVSHIGELPKYINIANKEKLLLKLDSLIQNNSSDLIEAYNLLDQTTHLEDQEKSKWIENNVSNLPGPFLVLNSVYLAKSSPEEAATWYVFGQIRMRLDAYKCTDHSAGSGIQIVRLALVPRFVAALKNMGEDDINKLLEKAASKGVALYKKTPYNIRKPYWIALHGTKAIIAGMDNKVLTDSDLFIPESEWIKREKTILDGFKTIQNTTKK